MIYVISKSTFGNYDVRDIQCNANWDCCPYSDYALIPDNLVEGILATHGYCDITLNADGTEVTGFTARSIPPVPEECCGTNTVLSVNGVKADTNGAVSLTPANVGAAAARKAVRQETNAVAWYRVGIVAQYHSCRITISSGYATREDMCVVLDALATYGSPVLNKVSEAYTNSNVKVIDQVRLVKDSGKYYVDIHYNHTVLNDVWVAMDGAEGWFEPWDSWVKNPEGTAYVTLAL